MREQNGRVNGEKTPPPPNPTPNKKTLLKQSTKKGLKRRCPAAQPSIAPGGRKNSFPVAGSGGVASRGDSGEPGSALGSASPLRDLG